MSLRAVMGTSTLVFLVLWGLAWFRQDYVLLAVSPGTGPPIHKEPDPTVVAAFAERKTANAPGTETHP